MSFFFFSNEKLGLNSDEHRRGGDTERGPGHHAYRARHGGPAHRRHLLHCDRRLAARSPAHLNKRARRRLRMRNSRAYVARRAQEARPGG